MAPRLKLRRPGALARVHNEAVTAKHVLLSALLVLSVAAPGLSQTARGNPVSRTPWGDPDLQGVWDFWTFTPLERPKEFADKPLLTDQEAAALAKRMREQAVAVDDVAPRPGGPIAYSQADWTDRARATVLNQTSLIVDPEDGQDAADDARGAEGDGSASRRRRPSGPAADRRRRR